ncbi:hypothetical protein [Nostoc sp. DSM 114167]|jgi:hypothetical protein|uniref:hypothetical protein n=1 Tax=Nostoc sp. DSM 114167 TaxID=3439050 RepID=UPI004045C9B8
MSATGKAAIILVIEKKTANKISQRCRESGMILLVLWDGPKSHWCQLNVKPMSCKELQFLAHSKSHLKDD